jgi:hypothetical protein
MAKVKPNKLLRLFRGRKYLIDKREPGATFTLTKLELKRAQTWSRLHMAVFGCKFGNKNAYMGTVGGRFHYTFTSTSIGELKSIYCACKTGLLLNGEEL